MSPRMFLEKRYELILYYPGAKYSLHEPIDAFEHDGKILLCGDNKVEPTLFKNHYRLLKWYEHRTIEQLLTIEYAKVIDGSNYYVKGDIVEVKEMRYNDKSLTGGRDTILFSLNGHHFPASQIEPATEKEYHDFKGGS